MVDCGGVWLPDDADVGKEEEPDIDPADVKVILLGDSAVGKSKLVERFLMDDYHPRQVMPLRSYGQLVQPSVLTRVPVPYPTAFHIRTDTVPPPGPGGWRRSESRYVGLAAPRLGPPRTRPLTVWV